MTDRLPGEEWKAYQRRTGGDYATWRKQAEDESDAVINRYRESMTPEEREAVKQQAVRSVREILDEWDWVRAQLKD
jgi:hypothetical protein